MRGSIKGGRYYLEGVEVTRQQFDDAFPDRDDHGSGQGLVGFKPLHSDALAVHPDQIPEAMAEDRKRGVPVDYDPHGRPVFTSSRQFRDYAKAYGNRHKGY